MLLITVTLHSGTGFRYVNCNVIGGSNTGTSWTDAYTSFQSALDAAISGDQIWVAKGTYKPSSDYGLGGGSRFFHFRMIEGVVIYGGFAGSESAVSERLTFGAGQANETILSGDIGTADDNTDNCYHVFYHPLGLSLTSSAVLDGFTIKKGNANFGSSPHYYGGGMYNSSSSPTLTNCTFISNSASSYGGGMYNSSSDPSSPTLTNCSFSSNSAGSGGGMGNYDNSSPTLTNCTFSSGSAEYGGGMDIYGYTSPILTNCTFSSNSAQTGGGINMYSSGSLTLNNCIIWGNTDNFDREIVIHSGTTTLNYSCYRNNININGGTLAATNHNITIDPQFVSSSINPTHPYSILGISPCVDAGLDSYNSQDYDIRGAGYSRKLSGATGATGTIDMGAYEYKLGVDALPVELTSFTASNERNGVSLNWQTATETNNYGFEVERRSMDNGRLKMDNWGKIGFVDGHGTTNAPQRYTFTDTPGGGKCAYRLKQIDRDGKYEYSKEVEAIVPVPDVFALLQNYPNPFNPTTVIKYSIVSVSNVVLKVYDVLGKEVVTLVNETKQPGSYSAVFNASLLANGLYFYRLEAGQFSDVKRLTLLK